MRRCTVQPTRRMWPRCVRAVEQRSVVSVLPIMGVDHRPQHGTYLVQSQHVYLGCLTKCRLSGFGRLRVCESGVCLPWLHDAHLSVLGRCGMWRRQFARLGCECVQQRYMPMWMELKAQ